MVITRRVLLLIITLLLVNAAPVIDANANGKHNSSGGCGCHSGGSGQVTPSLTGLPVEWDAGNTYSISIGGSGNPAGTEGGFSLTADKGTFSNAGPSVSISGLSVTHSTDNRRSWSVDWTAPSAGSGTVSFGLAVNFVNANSANSGDGWGTTTASVSERVVSNTAPTVSNLVVSPGIPTTIDNLVLTYDYDDADGDAESGTAILWFIDSIYQSQFDDQTTISSSNTAKGQSWIVRVTPSDGTDSGDEVSLSNPVVILNSAPIASDLQISPATPVESDDLIASYSYSDADSDAESGTLLRWYLDGNPVSDLDGQATVNSLMTRSGDEWSFTITPSDGEDVGQEFSSSTVIIGSSNTPPVAQSLSISPVNPSTLDDLTASWTYSDSDGDSNSGEELQWLLNGVHQPEYDDENPLSAFATSRGQSWSFQVRVSDGTVFSNIFASTSYIIANSAPEASEVMITTTNPDTTDDLHLTWTYDDADGDAESGTSISWYRDGTHVASADDTTILDSSLTQRSDQWHAVVEPSDGSSSGTPISSTFLTIGNSPPTISNAQWANDKPTVFDELSITFDSMDADGDEVTYNLVWYKEGFRVGDLDNSTTVEINRLDVDQSWEVMVTVFDSFGEGQSTSLTVIISNIAPIANFTTTADPPVAGATTTLNATSSLDVDGEIVVWLWEVGSEVLSGQVITTILPVGTTSVNLTVIDEHGGSTSIEHTFALSDPAIVSSLSVDRIDENVEITWQWSGDETIFHVYRSTSPIDSTTGMSPIASTSESSYVDPIRVEGEMHYVVTVDIRGVESPTLGGTANTAVIEIADIGSLIQDQHPSVLGLDWLYIMLSVIILSMSLGIALFERYKERGF